MTDREHISAHIKRAVLIEAGHRCAIQTCRHTTTEIAHITPWSKTRDNSFRNLIALCPNCHTLFDSGKIDSISMQKYKDNLSILNHRYNDTERRLFITLSKSRDRGFILGVDGDIQIANALNDGLFIKSNALEGREWYLQTTDGQGNITWKKSYPMANAYTVTAPGWKFIEKYNNGDDLS